MPAKRAIVIPSYQPLALSHDEQVQRLAQASAILAKGAARRRQAEAAQVKLAIPEEFIHNPPAYSNSISSSTPSHDN